MAMDPTAAAARDEQAWQRKLLPFMAGSIALMGAFFLIVSVVLLFSLYQEVRIGSADNIVYEPAATDAAAVAQAQWQTLVALEQKVIDHRYQQVNVTLMLRAWTRYLGFLTGMIQALVGAIFVLGKLRESGTSLNVEGSGFKGAITSSSPGLILASLGTLLMAITLVIPFSFDVRDVPVYLSPSVAAPSTAAPMPLASAAQLKAENCALFPGPECETHPAPAADASH